MPFTGRGIIPILNKYSISDVKLHIFNPEHEMALACDKTAMTLPHAIQEFKMNLGFLPALWAHDGDFVLVDDVLFALKALDKCHRPHADVLFVTIDDIKHLMFSHFEPWGWDKVVRQTLLNAGIPESLLPSDGYLSYIRSLADRRNTTCALSYLRSGIEEFVSASRLLRLTMPCSVLAELWLRLYGAVVAAAFVILTTVLVLQPEDGLPM